MLFNNEWIVTVFTFWSMKNAAFLERLSELSLVQKINYIFANQIVITIFYKPNKK